MLQSTCTQWRTDSLVSLATPPICRWMMLARHAAAAAAHASPQGSIPDMHATTQLYLELQVSQIIAPPSPAACLRPF